MAEAKGPGFVRQQHSEDSLPPVMPGIFRWNRQQQSYELMGAYSRAEDRYLFPEPDCAQSAGLESVPLGSSGTIYSYTLIHTRAPFGLPEPYAVGYIDLDQVPLRVFCLLDADQTEELAIGTRVYLQVRSMGCNRDGAPCLRPCFVANRPGVK